MLAAVGRGWPLFRWTSEPEPECTECFPVGAPARHVSVSRYTDQVDVYHTGSKAKRMALQIQQASHRRVFLCFLEVVDIRDLAVDM